MPEIDCLPPLDLAWPLVGALAWRCLRAPAASVAEAYTELRVLCLKGRVQSWGVRKARPYALIAMRPTRKAPDNLPERAEPIHDQLWLTYSELDVDGNGRPSGDLRYKGLVEWSDVVFSQPQLVSEWAHALRARLWRDGMEGDGPGDELLSQPRTAAPALTPRSPKLPEAQSVRRLSREKPFWPTARQAAFRWLDEEGCPAHNDGHQAALERYIAEWLSRHGHEASEGTIRRHVIRCIKERRAELGIS